MQSLIFLNAALRLAFSINIPSLFPAVSVAFPALLCYNVDNTRVRCPFRSRFRRLCTLCAFRLCADVLSARATSLPAPALRVSLSLAFS